MPAGSTYTPIATYTLPSTVASYAFTSIPSTYTDLLLVCNYLTESVNQQGYIRVNSDSGNNYSRTGIYGAGPGGGVGSYQSTNASGFNIGMNSQTGGQMNHFHIFNYSSTNMFKGALDFTGNATYSAGLQAMLWRNTAAINSLSIQSFDGSSSLQAGATFTLYGITAA